MTAVVPVHGSKARIYYHKIDMSDYAETIQATMSRDQAQHKPFSDSFVTVVPGQSTNLVLTIGGSPYIQDALATLAWAEMLSDTPRHFAYAPFGDVGAGVAICGKTVQNNQSVNASKSDIVRLPVGVVGTDEFDLCDILRVLATQSTSPSSYITGPLGGSANGGAGYLIVTAVGAGATLVVTIGHSTNHIDWSNLVTFEAVTPENMSLYEDDDWIVTSASMKVGAYSIANASPPVGLFRLTVRATAVGTADTMGTLAIVGTNSVDGAQTETMIPAVGVTKKSAKVYKTITSITGSGWVIDAGNGNDTIKCGYSYESVASQQVVVAPLATVNRYLRAEWTLTGGAATATFFVAFGRR